eukprot:562142-Pelagomonas_calceolata.AAC.1
MSFPHQKVRGKLVGVMWVPENIRSQGTSVMLSTSNFNGTSGRGKFVLVLHRVGMELSCKFGRPLRVNP